MESVKYLIYIDILGFEKLAAIISEEKGTESREIKKRFIELIGEKIDEIERRNFIIGKYRGSDDWLLVTDSIDNIFRSIYEILNHHLPYINYSKLPLEIAVGTAKYDQWAKLDGRNLIVENDTIAFLKTYIVNYFREWYKSKYTQSVKSTFIILTESLSQYVEPLDKKHLIPIRYKPKDHMGKELSFFSLSEEVVDRRGKLFCFLDSIGYAYNKWYGRIDEIYIPPNEYNEIRSSLDKRKFIFLTGTPEYGKTYTAVRLLWEYFNKGYQAKWIKGGDFRERIEAKQILEHINVNLMNRSIVYFEDPLGTIKYEKREALERQIGSIIEEIQKAKDTYVIITSREEIFKEFENEKISEKDLRDFENYLGIKKPSYDYKKRKEILLSWAEYEKCKWLKKRHLRNLILSEIDENKLPTPLSIKDFTIATSNIDEEDELIKQINDKSKETSKAFAKEIRSMTKDKALFLILLFIINDCDIVFLKKRYNQTVRLMRMYDYWEFARLIEWFKNDKIEIYSGLGYDSNNQYIRFSHPSYYEALEHLLFVANEQYLLQIFNIALLNLAEYNEAVMNVSEILSTRFESLKENERNQLLLILSMKKQAAGYISAILLRYFRTILKNTRNILLLNLADQQESLNIYPIVFKDYYNEIPEEVREELLLKLSTKEATAEIVKNELLTKYNKIPVQVRNRLLLNLAKHPVSIKAVSILLSQHFEHLPYDIKNTLLFKLSAFLVFNPSTPQLLNTYKTLSEETLGILLDIPEITKNIVTVLLKYFNQLSEQARELLFLFAESDKTDRYLAWLIEDNIEKLPESVLLKILKLLYNKSASREIVDNILAKNPDRFDNAIKTKILHDIEN